MRTLRHPTCVCLTAVLALASTEARAQGVATPAPTTPVARVGLRESGGWHLDLSLSNLFDGNINHDPEPVRSYGIVPAAQVRYESSAQPGFVWGYEIASNTFTGADEWDRVSQGLYSTVTQRAGSRVRFEGTVAATWKGSSEDRELSNEYGGSGRMSVRLLERTRLSIGGGYRYKQYPDDPGTSGPSPFGVVKIDQRFGGDRRLGLGYKYQTRRSRAVRDRYKRQAFTASFATPLAVAGDRLEVGVEFRPQVYQRLIRVGEVREMRRDLRLTVETSYRRPVSHRADVVWLAGLESRRSNDVAKRYFAPVFGMTMVYHWR